MNNYINFEEILKPGAKIYFIGIGGIGMSATAGIARQLGYDVSGSDAQVYAPSKDVLDDNDVPYTEGYSEKNAVDSQADLFVVSSGENLSNPEVKYVYDNDLPHVSFAQLLHEIAKKNLRIVVAGTNGKSTTTGLLGHVFRNLDDSSFMAGAVLKNYNSNYYLGDGHYFVFEGDEYKAEFDDPTPKFHYFKADILVLTNLEFDHPDMFESLESVEQEFRELIANLPDDGLIVYNADDALLTKLVHESNVANVSFAIDNEADYKAEHIAYEPDTTTVEILNKFSKNISAHLLGQTEQYKIQLPGKINVYNALAVISTLRALGFPQHDIALDLLSYQGLKRRFDVVGVKNGVTIVDDYAHHPTAVKATLDAARSRYFPLQGGEGNGQNSKFKIQNSRLWAVLEPHTFSRTKATLPELATAFEGADEVLISEIYPAREKATSATVSSEEVVEAIKSKTENLKSKTRLVHDKQEALDILKKEAKPGDVIIVMAVGDFNRLAYELKESL